MTAIVAAIYIVLALPVVPLLAGWRRIVQPGTSPRTVSVACLSLATLSYAWLLAILIWGRVIAPDYSDLRFNSIYANLAAVVIAIIVGTLRAARAKALILAALGLLLMLWLYAAVISSVV